MTGTTIDSPVRPWRGPFGLGLRLRLLGWALALLAVASLASVVVIRQVLLNQLENRIATDMRQEVTEFRRLVGGRDPASGQPFGPDLRAIADTYLLRNEPQAGEAVLVLVDGAFYRATEAPPYDLSRESALLRHWIGLTDSTYGQVEQSPGGSARWLAVPVIIDGAVRGQVVVVEFGAERRAEIDRAVQLMALACLLVIVVVAAGGYLAMGRALRPLRTVTETARTIEETDLSRRIPVTGSDEVADLAHTFNGMLGRLHRAFAAQQAFVSDAGHELRTPITIVRGHLELMGDDPADRAETIALVTDELDRMNRMVNDLLMLAKAEQPDFLHPDHVEVALMMHDVYAKAVALGDRDWRIGTIDEVTVWADRQRLTQALMQLAQNAVQFTSPGDTIELSAHVAESPTRGEHGGRGEHGRVLLAVRDTGVGIEPEDRERIFARFARAEHARARAEGAGLGLAIVAAIAEAHRGMVAVDSIPGAGSTFTLVLPAGAVLPVATGAGR
ncbi:sensor histidine kinase [Micromonospora pisi]|nr:HAMP domain-containing sensor histidine kinase [Micromonospora pisi]